MPKSNSLTVDQAIERALAELDGPAEVSAFVDKVLEIRPSSAKGAGKSVRNNMKYNFEGKSFVYIDKKNMVPLRVSAPGIRFRIPLSRIEVNRGILAMSPNFTGWFTYLDDPETFQFVDERGRSLSMRVISIKGGIDGIMASPKAFHLAGWFKTNKARRNDSVLVTIESWEPRRFKLELEPQKQKRHHRDEIASKNQELADLLFDMLETSVREQIQYSMAIPSAYIRLSDPRGYPGDHWADVINQDPRMKLTGYDIAYPEQRNLFDRILSEGKPLITEQEFSSEQGEQVYRFKAAFAFRKGFWRRIEIQGNQTLADFDYILRSAFSHDSSDHLSGFWKRVRRGQSNRFREVDLGSMDPFGGGDAADLRIAGLGLQVEDKMKYVYDFGDWIDHEITLEAIEESQPGVEYPRISEQNKPRYRYCEHCKGEGRKTVAEWICIECSDEKERQVLVCENCLDEHHEDHYADKIIY